MCVCTVNMKWLKMMANITKEWRKKHTRQIWQSKIMVWHSKVKEWHTKKKMICQKWHLPIDWRKFVCVMESVRIEVNNSSNSSRSNNKSTSTKFYRITYPLIPKIQMKQKTCASPNERTYSRVFFFLFILPVRSQCVPFSKW